MAAKKTNAKRGGPIIDPRLKRLVLWAIGPGRTAVLAVLVLLVFAAGWYYISFSSGYLDRVLASKDYWVTADQIDITKPPAWIRSDIRAQVFRDASLDGSLSLMDRDLTKRIAEAFALHPWVAQVVEVRKRSPARVEVDLVYRRPVCVVQVEPDHRLLPVDADGILLPDDDLSPAEKIRFPRLAQIDSVPVGSAGTSWGDARVIGGAEIAAAVAPVWDELEFDRIVPLKTTNIGLAQGPTFALYTRGESCYLWGQSPARDLPGEISPAELVARLVERKKEFGTLEGLNGPQEPLDIRSLRAMATPTR